MFDNFKLPKLFGKLKSRKMSDKIKFFEENGYVIFENAINKAFLQHAKNDLRNALKDNREEINCVRFSKTGKIYDFGLEDIFSEFNIVRITNIEQYSSLFRELALSDVVSDFLGKYYSASPTLLQSLTYAYSSHQGEHSDYHLVRPKALARFVGKYLSHNVQKNGWERDESGWLE